MQLSNFFTASFRRDIFVIITVICLLTVLISFRSIVTERSWRSPVGTAPKTDSKTTPPAHPAPAPAPAPPAGKEPVKADPAAPPANVQSSSTSATSSVFTPSPTPEWDPIVNACDGFPDTKDILVVMKTGATEAYDKLPIHFMTTLKCVNDSIIFSDMEMNMAGHHLIDTLEDIAPVVKKGNKDFDLYRTLQEYRKLGEDPRTLVDGRNGWNLDKYKFVQMLLKTWQYRYDADWYVFVEADTTMIWDNIRTFLNRFDPKKPYYIGSPTALDIEFAHGGTGYIISQAAMAAGVGKHPEIDQRYDREVAHICCGDRMIAAVMKDEHIGLTRAWPMLNGEKPLTLPFSKSHWCQPAMTMHHLTAQEVSMVWNFEQERKAQGIKKPLVWKDIYDKFVNASMDVPKRENWDNLSNDIKYEPDPEGKKDWNGRKWKDLTEVERNSASSPEECDAACVADSQCFQWRHHNTECKLHHSFSLGNAQRPSEGKQSISGWKLDRIQQFYKDMGDCPAEVEWIVQEPAPT